MSAGTAPRYTTTRLRTGSIAELFFWDDWLQQSSCGSSTAAQQATQSTPSLTALRMYQTHTHTNTCARKLPNRVSIACIIHPPLRSRASATPPLAPADGITNPTAPPQQHNTSTALIITLVALIISPHRAVVDVTRRATAQVESRRLLCVYVMTAVFCMILLHRGWREADQDADPLGTGILQG